MRGVLDPLPKNPEQADYVYMTNPADCEEPCPEQVPLQRAALRLHHSVFLRHFDHCSTHGPQPVGSGQSPSAAALSDGWHVRDDDGNLGLQGLLPSILLAESNPRGDCVRDTA